MKPGDLLIATPRMPDANFRKTLVLLVRIGDEGPIGLVLNRPTNETIGKVWAGLKSEGNKAVECVCEEPLYAGGPVFGPLCAIHKRADFSEEDVGNGFHWSSESDNLNGVVTSGESFRIFTGYTSWKPGQLEKEIEYNGWVCSPIVDESLVFAKDCHELYDPDAWRKALHLWGETQWKSFGIKGVPKDVRAN